jgi:hypothetical protein
VPNEFPPKLVEQPAAPNGVANGEQYSHKNFIFLLPDA